MDICFKALTFMNIQFAQNENIIQYKLSMYIFHY